VICLQETKLTTPSTFKSATFLPSSTSSFVALDVVSASGGIITMWDPRVVALDHSVSKRFSLTCFFSATADAQPIAVTNVYAPCNAVSHPAFFAKLVELAHLCTCPWLVLGDFNVTRAPEEKNTDQFDAVSTTLFTDTVDTLLLQELPLLDQHFTWTNTREVPTLVGPRSSKRPGARHSPTSPYTPCHTQPPTTFPSSSPPRLPPLCYRCFDIRSPGATPRLLWSCAEHQSEAPERGG
jgi:hypothetical protein